jgi:23S rRNA pseudouridine1911/1915/1917 synthase
MPGDVTSPPPEPGTPVTFTVAAEVTERLDRFLADQLQLSRTQAARLVAAKRVSVDGTVARASRLLSRGESVRVELPTAEPPRTLVPNPIALTVLLEDDHLAVIDKPAGLVVHPAPGHWDDTLVNALVARGTTLSGGAAGRPGIVHRLDRDTSGVMIVAKSDLAHRRLGAMLATRKIQRSYAALTWGHLDGDRAIEAPLGRHPGDRKRMTVREDGRPARTDVRVVTRLGPVDLLRLRLHSGRTHQIRVHLESIGHPVVGDPTYGGGGHRRISDPGRREARDLERLAPRQALHAVELAFRHPISGEPVRVCADWPEDLWPLLVAARGTETSLGTQTTDRAAALADLGFFGHDA